MWAAQSSLSVTPAASEHLCFTCEQYVSTDDNSHDGEEVEFDVTESIATPPHDGNSAGFEPQAWSWEKSKEFIKISIEVK